MKRVDAQQAELKRAVDGGDEQVAKVRQALLTAGHEQQSDAERLNAAPSELVMARGDRAEAEARAAIEGTDPTAARETLRLLGEKVATLEETIRDRQDVIDTLQQTLSSSLAVSQEVQRQAAEKAKAAIVEEIRQVWDAEIIPRLRVIASVDRIAHGSNVAPSYLGCDEAAVHFEALILGGSRAGRQGERLARELVNA